MRDNYLNLELSRHIESRVGSIDWDRRARKYFKKLKDSCEIISYTEAADILGVTLGRVAQTHHLVISRGGLGKKACMKVQLRGLWDFNTGRIKGLVKEDVIELKRLRNIEQED